MGGRARANIDSQMTMMAHLKELRTHLFLVAFVFIVFSAVGYTFRDEVLSLLLSPLEGQKLAYLTPGGGFSFIFKVTMWCGAAAALPILLFALYRFVSPALPSKAQSKSAIILASSLFLMVCGFLFGYVYAIPGAINFLLGFADEYVQSMLTADSYLNFVLAYTVGLGALFQIPLLLVIINWVKPLKPMKLLSFERYVVLGAFILAAFITPTPDVINQCVIALPIIVLYQLGVLVIGWVNWVDGRKARKHGREKAIQPIRKTDKPIIAIQPIVHRASTTPHLSHEQMQPTSRQSPIHTPRKSVDGLRPRAISRPSATIQIPDRHSINKRSIDGMIVSRPRSVSS